jgi:hypothetical protein
VKLQENTKASSSGKKSETHNNVPLRDKDLAKIQKHQDTVSMAQVGTDIRWDVVLPEMKRVDEDKKKQQKHVEPLPETPPHTRECSDEIETLFISNLDDPDIGLKLPSLPMPCPSSGFHLNCMPRSISYLR